MKRFLLTFFVLLCCTAVRGQDDAVSAADQEILGRMAYLMSLPEGTHTIYNGRGRSVFDVRYTIEAEADKTTVYKGGTKSYFDILYTIEFDGDGWKIFRGSSNSVFNQIYTVLLTDDGYEVYRGRGTFSSDLLYSYKR